MPYLLIVTMITNIIKIISRGEITNLDTNFKIVQRQHVKGDFLQKFYCVFRTIMMIDCLLQKQIYRSAKSWNKLLTEVSRASSAWSAAIWTATGATPSPVTDNSSPILLAWWLGMPPGSFRFLRLAPWEPVQPPEANTVFWGARARDVIFAPDIEHFRSDSALPTIAGAKADAIPDTRQVN